MCINCDLFGLLGDKDGADMFTDVLSMQVMRGLTVTRQIKENALKELEQKVPLFYCTQLFFDDFSRMRVLNLGLPKGFDGAKFRDVKQQPLTLAYFTSLKDVDFHLVPDAFAITDIDNEQRRKLITIGKLMTCNVQNGGNGTHAFMQGSIVPEDGPAVIREVLTFINDHKDEFKGMYRLVKSRCGPDALLFLRCMVQDLDDYVIRSVNSLDPIKNCISFLNESAGKDIDELMQIYKLSVAYHNTRTYLKHTQEEILNPHDPMILTKTVQ